MNLEKIALSLLRAHDRIAIEREGRAPALYGQIGTHPEVDFYTAATKIANTLKPK